MIYHNITWWRIIICRNNSYWVYNSPNLPVVPAQCLAFPSIIAWRTENANSRIPPVLFEMVAWTSMVSLVIDFFCLRLVSWNYESNVWHVGHVQSLGLLDKWNKASAKFYINRGNQRLGCPLFFDKPISRQSGDLTPRNSHFPISASAAIILPRSSSSSCKCSM